MWVITYEDLEVGNLGPLDDAILPDWMNERVIDVKYDIKSLCDSLLNQMRRCPSALWDQPVAGQSVLYFIHVNQLRLLLDDPDALIIPELKLGVRNKLR